MAPTTRYATLDRAIAKPKTNRLSAGLAKRVNPQRRDSAKGCRRIVLGAPQARICCRCQPGKDADLRCPIGAAGEVAAQSLISEETDSSLRLAGKGGALVTCGSTMGLGPFGHF